MVAIPVQAITISPSEETSTKGPSVCLIRLINFCFVGTLTPQTTSIVSCRTAKAPIAPPTEKATTVMEAQPDMKGDAAAGPARARYLLN